MDLKFDDFVKIFGAYQTYLTSQAAVNKEAPAPPALQQSIMGMPGLIPPQLPVTGVTPVSGTDLPKPADYADLVKRVEALETPKTPSLQNPAPVTVDDVIKKLF